MHKKCFKKALRCLTRPAAPEGDIGLDGITRSDLKGSPEDARRLLPTICIGQTLLRLKNSDFAEIGPFSKQKSRPY